ncbi:hypothetical protein CYMTET_23181 [Cymbomonas tetramitiformis]|uniref:Erythromycin esterase n=1 Tax=Cymbomonas tetramitiformis TaxID=36881 RepID=A0AAE0L1J4_9CHLO|nr:hypothetical protein CYMTET_23181 [Cymbomonas tetramitiformis]
MCVEDAANIVAKVAMPLVGIRANDYYELRGRAKHADAVLIGEASHGTQEFYQLRADITKALLENDDDLCAVLLEADFPPLWEINRYAGGTHADFLRDKSSIPTLDEVFAQVGHRFPKWMWQNEVTRDFVKWLKEHNAQRAARKVHPVMILGLDIYSLFSSAKAVISYLRALDPLAASFAKDRYAELEKFGPEAERYSNAYYEQLVESQATNVSVTLSELLAKEPVYSIHPLDGDEFFSASENAHIVQSAEAYYRKSILGGSAVTWNLRDKSMYDTFAHTLDFLKRKRGKAAKAIVWAHNSHLGDARATEKHERQSGREINIGQLIREHLGEEKTFIIGFSTDTGTVRAATGWGRKGRKMDLVPSIQNSYGNVMHRVTQLTGFPAFGVSLTECRKSSAVKGGASVDVGGDSVDARENADPAVAARIALTEPRLERFIANADVSIFQYFLSATEARDAGLFQMG